jgi:hypothetical protein
MLVVAPFWALLAAYGWDYIFEKLQWRHAIRYAAIAALVPALINLKFNVAGHTVGYKVLPLALADDWQYARRIARWYQSTRWHEEYPYLMASHPGVYFFADISPTGTRSREWKKETIENIPSQTLLVWDPIYGVYNADERRSVTLEFLKRNCADVTSRTPNGWLYVTTVNQTDSTWPELHLDANGWHIFVSNPLRSEKSLVLPESRLFP